MKTIYQNLNANLNRNTQMLCLLRYASRVRRVSILGCGNGLSLLTAIAAKPDSICLYNQAPQETNQFSSICAAQNIRFEFQQCDYNQLKIADTDLLYIDTFAEGQTKYTELMKHHKNVSRYILVTGTYDNAHDPDPNVRIDANIQTCGLIHGINNFINQADSWHILEHLYYGPGVTVLYDRKDISDDGR
jgi:hypothetical protein